MLHLCLHPVFCLPAYPSDHTLPNCPYLNINPSVLLFFVSFVHCELSGVSFMSVAQVLAVSGSVPLKVSAALCAAQEAAYSLQDLLQRERMISNILKQVKSQC